MCLHPIPVRYSNAYTAKTGFKTHLVPCGKCWQCLQDYQRAWECRLLVHLRDVGKGIFFTLTYNDDSVPLNVDSETGDSYRSVRKYQLKRFFKSCRDSLYRDRLQTGLSWFITSEYGPLTLRPHYHGIIFNIDEIDFVLYFLDPWRKLYGFTSHTVLSFGSSESRRRCRYVAKYCAKANFENPLVKAGKVEPTFHIISKGIGKSYLNEQSINYHLAGFVDSPCSNGVYSTEYLERLLQSMSFNLNGRDYKLPRYYRETVFKDRKFLQSAFADYVSTRSVLLRESKLESLQSHGISASEAHKIILDQEISETVSKDRELADRFSRELSRSKI